MMHISYISDSSIPSRAASAIQVMKMCEAFAKRGHRVDLYVPYQKKEANIHEGIFSYYGIRKKFNVLYVPCFSHWGRIVKNSIFAFRSANVAIESNPSVVYSRFLPSCWLCSRKGLVSIFEAHVPPTTQRPSYLVDQIFKLWNKHQNRKGIVTISSQLKNHFEQRYGCKDIFVAHDAASIVSSAKQQSLKMKKRVLHVGYAGHLYPGKGMELIHELAKRCSWVQFHIIGGIEDDIQYWRKECVLQENITFHGYVPPSMTEQYRQICDVLIAPYQREVRVYGEGNNIAPWMSPLKLFEYMASGKAILCSDLAPLREFLTHETTALMCDPEDFDAWVSALKILLDKPLRMKLGQNAQEEFFKKHTWDKRAEAIEGYLENLLKSDSY